MEKQNQRGKYQVLMREQKEQILTLKQKGIKNSEISYITGVNKKTIQSTTRTIRKTKYHELEQAIIQYMTEKITINKYNCKLPQNAFKSFVIQEIKQQINWDTSNFQEFISERKKSSQRRRILEKLTKIILSKCPSKQSNNCIVERGEIQIKEDITQNQSTEIEFDQIQEVSSFFVYENLSNYIDSLRLQDDEFNFDQ